MIPAANLAHFPQGSRAGESAWHEYRATIENAITNHPRSLQKRIGPSELGCDCDRCLISKLAGIPEKREAAWLPTVGTAVHTWLQDVFIQANAGLPNLRYLLESTVNVGTVGGINVTGNADLFDLETSTVSDWKITGVTTLRSAKAHGPSLTYRRQAHLYGRGFTRRGIKVSRVQICYLPRNEPTLAGAYIWSEPYDESIALETLARADMFATAIGVYGPDQVLASAPPHNGGFSCAHYPGNPMPGHAHQPGADLKGLIAS